MGVRASFVVVVLKVVRSLPWPRDCLYVSRGELSRDATHHAARRRTRDSRGNADSQMPPPAGSAGSGRPAERRRRRLGGLPWPVQPTSRPPNDPAEVKKRWARGAVGRRRPRDGQQGAGRGECGSATCMSCSSRRCARSSSSSCSCRWSMPWRDVTSRAASACARRFDPAYFMDAFEQFAALNTVQTRLAPWPF